MDKKRKKWFFFVAPPAFLLFIALGGALVMQLWNWLLPELFGWRTVTFWQALGLLALCRILFGGFGSHGVHSRARRREHGHREELTPEERDTFRRWLETRRECGTPPDAQPEA